jgi:general secretion pathway protein J
MRPASEAALSPETRILDGVSGLGLRAYAGPEDGWVAGWGQPGEEARQRLPRAIEVTLESELYGPIVILVALP